MIDKYKIDDYKKRLEKEKSNGGNHLKMIYMWVKQDVITLDEFKELISHFNQLKTTRVNFTYIYP